ncbi:MAG: Nif11-like leader peptide family RiPP precursor [Coriobacteriales bacterium]|nr:Nif11-like leader peptide family RiPP precursor [Coriobacteriales bacterium]
MSTENAKAFLKEGFEDPKVVELLKEYSEPATQEETLAAYVNIAKKTGFDFTEEELTAAIAEMDQETASRTEMNVKGLELLPDEGLAQVAGGVGHPYCPEDYFSKDRSCKDTYENYENCWHNDGCDWVYHDYYDYMCKRTNWKGHP